jgi:hypothetical protein
MSGKHVMPQCWQQSKGWFRSTNNQAIRCGNPAPGLFNMTTKQKADAKYRKLGFYVYSRKDLKFLKTIGPRLGRAE